MPRLAAPDRDVDAMAEVAARVAAARMVGGRRGVQRHDSRAGASVLLGQRRKHAAIVRWRRVNRQYDRLCVLSSTDTRKRADALEIETPPGVRELLLEQPPYRDAKRDYRGPYCRAE